MNSRRLAAVALCLMAFAGCHEDPTVVEVAVTPSVQALALFAGGGTASSLANVDGAGGTGGEFRVKANGLISLGSPSFIPTVPSTPPLPTSFQNVATSPVGPLGPSGSILLAGSLTTTAVASVLIESLNGDILVSGTLQSGTTGGAQTNITLRALNGTVFLTGAIRTAGVDSALDGRAGGNLTIDAARVVITGSIDTHGVANSTVAGVNGGKGGDVDILAHQGPISITAGAIVTTGGDCVDTVGIVPSLQGGNGGFVHLNTLVPTNAVHIFAPITTNGGAMTGLGTTPEGGDAGEVSIRGIGSVNIVAALSLLGGAATGNADDAVGGTGGSLKVDGPATCRLYGSLVIGGGTAFAAVTGGTVQGGTGGSVLLGQVQTLDAVELGDGDYGMSGGAGKALGGTGGQVAIESFDGDITIGSSLSVAGGAATGVGNFSGGPAGTISIKTDATAAHLINHDLSIASRNSLLDAAGGAGLGSGAGGLGGSVLLQCAGDLTCGARVIVSGGSTVTGAGGTPALIAPAVAGAAPNSSIVLRIFSTPMAATGNMVVTGSLLAQGGAAASGGTGGSGRGISLLVTGVGSLESSATINSSGAGDAAGAGGVSGAVQMTSATGAVDLSGTVTTSGTASPTSPKDAGSISIDFGAGLTSRAVLNASGGSAVDLGGAIAGAAGGTIRFSASNPFGGLTLSPGSSIVADGGSATGTMGGPAGTITLETIGQPISLSGPLVARGGGVSGTGVGGIGGLIVVNSDTAPIGTGGAITLQADGVIDVSGGAGSVGGPARSTFTDTTTLPDPPVNLAVVFDANNDLAGTGGIAGKVINLGQITAAGGVGPVLGVGGDVFFHGLNSAGAAVGLLDGGAQNRAGSVAGEFFPH